MIKGYASKSETKKYSKKFIHKSVSDFYSTTHNDLKLSSVGIGMYKGMKSDKGDKCWEKALNQAILGGINVIDNAIRYRGQRSEKLLGKVISNLIKDKKISRKEIFVTSKGGLIGTPYNQDDESYVKKYLINTLQIKRKEIYQNIHCLALKFLKEQFKISRKNLGLSTLDCYFIHNPELAKSHLDNKQFYKRLELIFKWLESLCKQGKIKNYGIASWNGFRRRQGARPYLDISKIIKIAKLTGGKNHHLRFIEAPLSVGMPFIHNYNWKKKKNNTNLIKFLYQNNINFFSSASTYEGNLQVLNKLTELFQMIGKKDSHEEDKIPNISLPLSENSLIQLFELLYTQVNKKIVYNNKKIGLYPSALNYVRSYPYLTTALCGMNQVEFVKENLILKKIKKLKANDVLNLFTDLTCYKN